VPDNKGLNYIIFLHFYQPFPLTSQYSFAIIYVDGGSEEAKMKLLTKAIENRFKKVGCQDGKGDAATIIAKFFTPDSNWTWYATEYNPETQEFFGLVKGFEAELGYFSLGELQTVRGGLGLPVERDMHFGEKTIGEVRN